MPSSTLRVSFLAASCVLLTACPKGADQDPGASSIGSATDDTADPTQGDTTVGDGGVCLLHNCDDDSECGGCTEGRNSCYAPSSTTAISILTRAWWFMSASRKACCTKASASA